MARLINTTMVQNLYVNVKTIFTNETYSERKFTIDDMVEDLRYAENGEIKTITGRVASINYTMKAQLKWNSRNPSDTLAEDMTLKSITIDVSDQYHSNLVTVPCKEILEDQGANNVKMVQCIPQIKFDVNMYYSNRSVSTASIEVGDVFNNMIIINPANVGYDNDYVGTYKVIGMGYKSVNNRITVTTIAFQNLEDNKIVNANIDHILYLNELYTYNINNEEDLALAISSASNNDTITINGEISTVNNPIIFNNISVTMNLKNAVITTDNTENSGITVKNGGALTINDLTSNSVGRTLNNMYDTYHNFYIVGAVNESDLTINSGTFESGYPCIYGDGSEVLIADGTFTSTYWGPLKVESGKLTINGGVFTGKKYSILTYGDSECTINGGEFKAINDGADLDNGLIDLKNATIFNITNGTFEVNGATLFHINAVATGVVELNISGGTFDVGISGELFALTYGASATYENNVSIQITGGNFSKKPNAGYIAEGYACSDTANDDGYYVVSKVVETEPVVEPEEPQEP